MLIRFSVTRSFLLAGTLFGLAWQGSARAQVSAAAVQAQSRGALGLFGDVSLEPAETPPPPGGEYEPAKIGTRAPVAYPTLADLNRIEGVVTIRFYIDETGHVTRTAVVKTGAPQMLTQLVHDPHLEEWTFQPATLNGKPVPSTHDQEFEFKLDPDEQKRLALRRLALPFGTPDPPYPPAAAASHLQGSVTIGVRWTKQGLVGAIGMQKSSGSPFLDVSALRFAYENWRIDPAAIDPDRPFIKTVRFDPPQ